MHETGKWYVATTQYNLDYMCIYVQCLTLGHWFWLGCLHYPLSSRWKDWWGLSRANHLKSSASLPYKTKNNSIFVGFRLVFTNSLCHMVTIRLSLVKEDHGARTLNWYLGRTTKMSHLPALSVDFEPTVLRDKWLKIDGINHTVT